MAKLNFKVGDIVKCEEKDVIVLVTNLNFDDDTFGGVIIKSPVPEALGYYEYSWLKKKFKKTDLAITLRHKSK